MSPHYLYSDDRIVSRREFLRRGILLSTGAAAGSTLLAACWPFGDDEDDDTDEAPSPTPEDEQPEPTPEETPEPTPTPTPEATPTPEPTPTPEAPPDEPEAGGTLTIALTADPFSLHPNADESTANWSVMSQLYDALMEVDHQFEPVPVLAESFEVAEDGSAYTFTIPDDVLFHNGEPLTADDVVFTHEWMSVGENGGARSFYYERVESIEAEDSVTITFNMSAPDGTLLRRAASTFIMSAAYHEEFGWEGQSLNPIGTGPFQLDNWTREESIRLVRFDDYFNGPAYLEQIDFEVIGDGSDRRSAIENGEVDVAWDLGLDASQGLVEEGNIQTVESVNLDCLHIALNNQHPALADRNVRLAMQYAIDRSEIVDIVYQGEATEATSYLSPALFYWHQEILESRRQLTDRAIELLDESGWTVGDGGTREREGQALSFTCIVPDGGDLRAEAAEAIADTLSEIGIDMGTESAPLSETLNQMREGEIDAAIFNWTYGGWLGEPDGRTTLLTGAFNNFSQFSSIQVDNVLYQGVAEVDPEGRRAIYRNLQERIADQSPFLFLAFPHSWYHFNHRVQGLPDSVRWGSRSMRKLVECWVWDPD